MGKTRAECSQNAYIYTSHAKDFYVLGHISNIFASLWANTVMKLETVLTRDGRLPVG